MYLWYSYLILGAGGFYAVKFLAPAAKEQVKSLGASFIAVEDEEFKEAESAGGYAKEMSTAAV